MPCLTTATRNKFLAAIKSGVIDPATMVTSTSKQRLAILEPVVGEENAGWVNAALESKLILKDQQRGMVSWAKKVSGITPEVRRDLITRIQKETKVFDPATSDKFLESLAAKKFGHDISFDEAKNISGLANRIKVAKAKITPSDGPRSAARMEYGTAVVVFKDYVGQLKLSAEKVGLKWYLRHPLASLGRAAGVSKSLLSTLDNSFFGRQGIKVLYNHPFIWVKNFAKSWGDIGKELIGRDAMLAIRADVYSRPNAVNGKYEAMKLDVGVDTEEAFPSHILTHIPGVGRLAKAAESAFNGAALRLRADIGDIVIRNAERNGHDMSVPAVAQPLGRIVNSMTGRGNIGGLDKYGKQINATIFSIKFLKANVDTLTAHQFQKDITPYARKVAAMNLVRIIGSTAGILTLAKLLLGDDAVEEDPRSTDFGKIKVGDTTYDITGGMASVVTLAARMVPTMHDGEMGWYTKNRKGEVVPLGTGKYGSRDPLDVFWDFWEGKAAPYTALLRDMYRGKDFKGRQTYVEGHRIVPTWRTVYGTVAPIPLQQFEENMKNPNVSSLLMTTIADALGFSTNTADPDPKKKREQDVPWDLDELVEEFLNSK